MLGAGKVREVTLGTHNLNLVGVTVSHPDNLTQALAAIQHLNQTLWLLNPVQYLLPLVPGLFMAQTRTPAYFSGE